MFCTFSNEEMKNVAPKSTDEIVLIYPKHNGIYTTCS